MLRYCSLFSGSTGNCTYVGQADGGLLVDTGVSAKRIRGALEERQIDPCSIRAVLVTHEHTDHVAGLRVLCRAYGWPVLASAGTLDALAEAGRITPQQRLYALPAGQTVTVGSLRVTPFATPHDSRQCFGYRIEAADGRAVAVATDIGRMTQEILDGVTGCGLVHIESNHDPDMLQNGPYPYVLKQRIRGEGGHLANGDCAAVLPQLAAAGTTRFVLAHLSEHNNTPALARETATAALAAAGCAVGRDCLLAVAEPTGTQPVTYF